MVETYRSLATALVVVRWLIQRARRRYRWPTRPAGRRLTDCLVPVARPVPTARANCRLP